MLVHMNDREMLTVAKGLILTKEQEEICKLLYRKTDGGYLLYGFYNPDIPDEDYPDDLAAFPVRSSFGGYAALAGGSKVYNVDQSSRDKYKIGNNKYNDAWIKIWENNIIAYDAELDRDNPLPNHEKHNNHERKSYVEMLNGRTDSSLVGGHICTAREYQRPGRGGSCLLLPIYKYLNSMRTEVEMTIIPCGAVALRLVNFLE